MVRIKQVFRAIVAGALTLTVALFWKNPEKIWLILSSLILINLQIEKSFFKNQLFMLVVGILILVNICVVHFFGFYIFLLAGYLFTTTFFSAYTGWKYPRYFYPAFMINLLGIFAAASMSASQMNLAEAILGGVVLVLILRCFLWPTTFRSEIRVLYQDYCDALQALQKQIFEIYLRRDYVEHTYLYEKELHHKRFAVLEVINRMRILLIQMPPKLSTHYIGLVNRLDCLIEAVIVLGSLRYEIRDFSTLEVCEKELKAAMDHIADAFEKIKRYEPVAEDFSMESFEMLYQTTLQVVTNEPRVYLVFIHNIKQLLADLKNLSLIKEVV